MSERRYTEDEAAAIFRRAAEAETTGSRAETTTGPAEGRTLAELMAIGSEVGLSTDLVARAAREVENAGGSERQSFLGFPLRVGHTVHLDRHLSEEEWGRLVADLRITFNARGRVAEVAGLREWRNGNLRASLERTPSGDRFRIQTMKGDARGIMLGGAALMGIAMAVLLTYILIGAPADDWAAVYILSILGAGMFGAGAVQLPGWASRRLEQMEDVAGRLLEPTPDA